MKRQLSYGGLHVLVLSAVVAMGLGTEAGAWSYGSWGSYGSAGSYGSYASYGWGGCFGSYGRVGPLRRMAMNIRARRAARASYGSYGSYACYGSYGSYASYGSYGSYTVGYSSYGSAGSYGSTGSYGSYGSYQNTSPPPPPADGSTEGDGSTTTDSALKASGSAVVEVAVPATAQVFVNDKPTTSEGENRSYVSNGLLAGKTYRYDFRVEYDADGEKVVKNKTVKLSAGDRVTLTFSPDSLKLAAASGADTTELKLTVPENAKVFLAGAATEQTGEHRDYTTNRLAVGESWKNYTVRVEFQQDGEPQVREETLTIEGGQTYDLNFMPDNKAEAVADSLAQVAK